MADEQKVNLYGKVAKFPKNVKASHAFNFLENIKMPKKKIWYIMVEKQDNQLQMIKYNNKQGFDLKKFVENLKVYYSNNPILKEHINNLEIGGNENFSTINNIPNVEINGQKLISILMNDLIRLLK
jgi:hypothetical protein